MATTAAGGGEPARGEARRSGEEEGRSHIASPPRLSPSRAPSIAGPSWRSCCPRRGGRKAIYGVAFTAPRPPSALSSPAGSPSTPSPKHQGRRHVHLLLGLPPSGLSYCRTCCCCWWLWCLILFIRKKQPTARRKVKLSENGCSASKLASSKTIRIFSEFLHLPML